MKKVNYLIITAAGQGTRMKEVNPNLPKEMLSIGNKPAILYSVEEAVSAQIENIIIVLNRDKDTIKNYFEDKNFVKQIYPNTLKNIDIIKSKCNIYFVYQYEPKGEIDAICKAKDIIGNNPFAVIYPDDIHFPPGYALNSICNAYSKFKKDIVGLTTFSQKNSSLIGNTGKVNLKKYDENIYKIIEFLPKTMESFVLRYKNELRACGLMVYHENAFKYIKDIEKKITSKECTDIELRTEMMNDRIFLGYKLNSDFFDIGNPNGYKKCLTYIQKFGKGTFNECG